jgi:heme/copper-type cytochrome/quinol oxidase subunit 2
MNEHMNKSLRNLLIVVTLVVVAILAILWASTNALFPRFPWEPRMPPPQDIRGDIELFYTMKTVISTMNVTLLVFLLLTYVSIYLRTRSEFTIGLIIFSAIFLLNVLASNPMVMWICGYRPSGLGPFAMLPDLFTFVALVVLLYLSVKY